VECFIVELRVIEIRVLRKIFWSYGEEVTMIKYCV
jgi:hypothetical protein